MSQPTYKIKDGVTAGPDCQTDGQEQKGPISAAWRDTQSEGCNHAAGREAY